MPRYVKGEPTTYARVYVKDLDRLRAMEGTTIANAFRSFLDHECKSIEECSDCIQLHNDNHELLCQEVCCTTDWDREGYFSQLYD